MIDTLAIPASCVDIEGLCRHISGLRARPVVLRAIESGDAEHCALVSTQTQEVIFYPQHTTRAQHDAIIGHVLGHVVFGDSGIPGPPHGAGYSSVQEQRAEVFSSLAVRRLADHTMRQQTADPAGRPQAHHTPVALRPDRHR